MMATQPTPPTPQSPPAPPANLRTAILSVFRKSFSRTDGFQQTARAFRNRLVIMSLVCFLVDAVLVVIQWRLPQAIILKPPNTDASRWALLLLLMVFGSVGGLVSAIPAVAAIPTVQSPFNFPMQQALLKVVFGSLTALSGVIVLDSASVTNGFGSLEALLGAAIVFGAAQQVVTQYLDRRAGKLLSGAG